MRIFSTPRSTGTAVASKNIESMLIVKWKKKKFFNFKMQTKESKAQKKYFGWKNVVILNKHITYD